MRAPQCLYIHNMRNMYRCSKRVRDATCNLAEILTNTAVILWKVYPMNRLNYTTTKRMAG